MSPMDNIGEPPADPFTIQNVTYTVSADVVDTAVENGILALEPTDVGDHGLLVPHPADWVAEVVDVTKFEDLPRRRELAQQFSRWQSLAGYVGRYNTPDTLGYVTDLNGKGAASLVTDVKLIDVVIDDHPAVDGSKGARRAHRAGLTLRPTPAARRWGAALQAATINQETLLDLVVDGITEIANPDGAVLRDLIADLHAVRTTEARSVIRTGGQSTVELADNVALHAGTGNTLTIPETFDLVFRPWTAVDDRIVVTVRLKPTTDGKRITFKLDAPALDDELSKVVETIARLVADDTACPLHWVP